MEQLIKQTSSGPVLNGYEKTAILLGELDNEAFHLVMEQLNLSRKQLNKIRKEMKKLGKYNPNDYRQTRKETSVLSEMVNFFRRINHAERKSEDLRINLNANIQHNDSVKNLAAENPDAIANILKTWLSEK
ncbi:MAG: hypothetical protein MJ179_09950 [Treponema sp.]|nr:hypothetical protein [Treponema sp.]